MNHDICILCGRELVTWERTRSECWDCRELTSVTYDDTETVDYDDLDESPA